MRSMVLAALVAVAAAGCGGGGGGVPGSPAPGDGGQTPPPGGGVPVPVPPLPPAPLPEAPAPILEVNCVHAGGAGTKEINVGGPAGSPNRVDNIVDVAWEALNPGDTVRIHWRDTAYAERIALFRSGTAAQPVRVCGVPGGADGLQRPHITGIDAKTRTSAAHTQGTVRDLAPYGIVTISGRNFESRVEHVILENLRIGDTKTGDGVADNDAHDASFTDGAGNVRKYNGSAACIRMRQAHHITIRSNEIVNCADGIFAGSLPDSDNHIIRNLVVEGNYLHGSSMIGEEGRHQAYLQGIDITVQFNYFGRVRTNASGIAGGNQLKMRAAGLVVRYNYIRNGARALDLVEAEEHISHIAPWAYAELRERYLGCQQDGCLKLDAAQLAQYDARQQQAWAKYQAGYVYGNLLHATAVGGQNRVPTNLVHYGFDNSQHDRQPGTLWFFHNTVLWETNRGNQSVVRLFDYGSDFGDGGYYGYSPALKNVGGQLHYITDADGHTCQTLAAGCTDWGPMLQTTIDQFGRMRAFNNALVRTSATAGQNPSDFEFTRFFWDKLDMTGPMWITAGWEVDNGGDDNGGGFGHRLLPENNVYAGGNAAHHVTGVASVVTGAALPIDRATFAPVNGSPLRNAAGPWPAGELADALKPAFNVTVDPAAVGRLVVTPRAALTTIGASQ